MSDGRENRLLRSRRMESGEEREGWGRGKEREWKWLKGIEILIES